MIIELNYKFQFYVIAGQRKRQIAMEPSYLSTVPFLKHESNLLRKRLKKHPKDRV